MSDSYPESLSALQALRMLGDERRALLVDIRSSDEFLSGGHPAGAVNIPWFDEPDWQINPNFVAELRRARGQSADDGDDVNGIPLILICRSGRRSLLAGQALLSAGLRSIYHVQDGFEGEADAACQHGSGGSWCFHGLPREQS